ncbi:hypothetical protein V1478_003873 [Vespula squamosa]|uniref:Uncharacterized protein n=1 Tax=Vespula squamosa TaxID=30214 RepID=A0ABD2BND8_VESSQ
MRRSTKFPFSSMMLLIILEIRSNAGHFRWQGQCGFRRDAASLVTADYERRQLSNPREDCESFHRLENIPCGHVNEQTAKAFNPANNAPLNAHDGTYFVGVPMVLDESSQSEEFALQVPLEIIPIYCFSMHSHICSYEISQESYGYISISISVRFSKGIFLRLVESILIFLGVTERIFSGSQIGIYHSQVGDTRKEDKRHSSVSMQTILTFVYKTYPLKQRNFVLNIYFHETENNRDI